MSLVVIVPAAGTGSRFGGGLPKQFQTLAGKPVIQHVIERFLLDELVTRGVHEQRTVGQRLEDLAIDDAARAIAELEMHRENVGLAREIDRIRDPLRAELARARGGERSAGARGADQGERDPG